MGDPSEIVFKEYGILKAIFKHLSLNELLVVGRVCRTWQEIVKIILLNELNGIPQVNLANVESCEFSSYPKLCYNLSSVPGIIIRYSTVSKRLVSYRRLSNEIDNSAKSCDDERETREHKKWLRECDLNPKIVSIFSCDSFSYLSKQYNKERLQKEDFIHTGSDRKLKTEPVLILPKLEGVHYSIFQLSADDLRKSKFNLYLKELEENLDKGPVRCILLYEDIKFKYQDLLIKFIRYMDAIVRNYQTTQFAFGGGKLSRNIWTKIDSENLFTDICGVIIRGENIIAHSTILEKRFSIIEMEDFFVNLAEEIGPLPKGADRIGIIAQCVERPNYFKDAVNKYTASLIGNDPDPNKAETIIFAKYFPDVPTIGFSANGEYGLKAVSTENFAVKKYASKNSVQKKVFFSFTSSIVILTYFKNNANK